MITDTIGLVFGAAGSWPVAMNSYKWRMIGFALWVVSDLFWIVFGVCIHSWPLVLINALYAVTSAVGFWNARKALRISREFLHSLWK